MNEADSSKIGKESGVYIGDPLILCSSIKLFIFVKHSVFDSIATSAIYYAKATIRARVSGMLLTSGHGRFLFLDSMVLLKALKAKKEIEVKGREV